MTAVTTARSLGSFRSFAHFLCLFSAYRSVSSLLQKRTFWIYPHYCKHTLMISRRKKRRKSGKVHGATEIGGKQAFWSGTTVRDSTRRGQALHSLSVPPRIRRVQRFQKRSRSGGADYPATRRYSVGLRVSGAKVVLQLHPFCELSFLTGWTRAGSPSPHAGGAKQQDLRTITSSAGYLGVFQDILRQLDR